MAQCYDAGKAKGLSFVGVSNGNECWGTKEWNLSYPKVSWDECQKDCPKDKYKKCGDLMRSNVYDIRQYHSSPNFKACTKRPIDCSKLGGYNLTKDKCYTTCNKVDTKKLCYDKCGKTIIRTQFKSYNDYYSAR
jgi:hypothetical protein